MDEHVGAVEDRFHALGIGHEIRRQVTLVELHALDHVERGFDGLGLFDRDGAVLADLVHRVGDDLADVGVPVGRDGGNLRDFRAVADLLGNAGEFFDQDHDGLVDAALESRWVRTRRHVAETFLVDGLGEHGRGGGAVAGDVAGLAGDLTHELRAHVLVGVFQFDLLGDGHAVLGDRRRAEFLVEDDVAARGSKRRLDRTREFLDAAQEGLAGVFVKLELFCCHNRLGYVLGECV